MKLGAAVRDPCRSRPLRRALHFPNVGVPLLENGIPGADEERVEMALERLSEKGIVSLDEERKAAMVSNLLVVLCSERAATPVVNAGTLYNG